MGDEKQIDQFLQSWWNWRSKLPEGQRWMADAMTWSATHGADVQGYKASQWSSSEVAAWLREQDSSAWQKWSREWKSENWAGARE